MQSRFAVRIGHLDDSQMALMGFRLVAENDNFKIYEQYNGDRHIVHRANPWVVVDDVNDAMAMGTTQVVVWQPRP